MKVTMTQVHTAAEKRQTGSTDRVSQDVTVGR